MCDVANLVLRLPPATLVFVRYIADQSYRDSELCLTDAIPEEPPPVNCAVTNPFDFLQKRRCKMEKLLYKARLRCLDNARKRIAVALRSLAPARSRYTDIWGAIAAASEILIAYPKSKRIIIIYSDLNDNAGIRLPGRLPGLEGG